MPGVMRIENHLKVARQFLIEVGSKLHQARRHQLVDLRQADAEIVNREHIEVAAQKTERRHQSNPTSLRDSGALTLLKTLFPVPPVEMVVLQLVQVDAVKTSHVDVDAFGIGSRNIKRCDAAIRA